MNKVKCSIHPNRDAYGWIKFKGTVMGWSFPTNAFCRECFEYYSEFADIEAWGTNGNDFVFRRDRKGKLFEIVDGRWVSKEVI